MSAGATRQDVDGASGVLVATSGDPTRTQTVEERYAQRLRGGYARLNALVREFVGERDVLGLGELIAAHPPPDFSFSRNDQKVEGFRRWLDQAQDEEVLGVVDRNGNRYVHQSYETGVRATNADIRRVGVGAPSMEVATALQLPVHAETLQLLYTRNFNELQGLTDEMGRDVARELTEALAEGTGPRNAARRITDILGSIEDGTPHGAMARATTIARTEILRARHLAAQKQYQRFGVKLVEPILAPNACSECVTIAMGAPYKVKEISDIWPIHPNCRCSVTIYRGGQVTASAHAHGHTHAHRVPVSAIARTAA